jgi:hypothetical protein
MNNREEIDWFFSALICSQYIAKPIDASAALLARTICSMRTLGGSDG